MKIFHRLIAMLLIMGLVLPMVPVHAFAEDALIVATVPIQGNPLYAATGSVEDVPYEYHPEEPCADVEYGTVEQAKIALRNGMKNRETSITVYVHTQYRDFKELFRELFFGAMEHTGNPTEGDYLAYQYGSYGGGYSGRYDSLGNYYLTYQFRLTYYDTAAQEAQMDTAVEELLDQLNLYGENDYEKICGIYNWMCDNITYDYANMSNPDYLLMYTAYAALVNRASVCQGYATLFYRLALELGVDCRIISGTGISNTGPGPHAWNIVGLNGSYYDTDVTWDATWKQAGLPYEWFLKNEQDFSADHIRDDDYTTAAFHGAYPMAEKDYDPADFVLGSGSCGENLTWVLEPDGTLTISGDGDLDGYTENSAPWYEQSGAVTAVVIEEGATGIGAYAFFNCQSLQNVAIPDTVTDIGASAFGNCASLTEIQIPENVTGIGDCAFADCKGLEEIVFRGNAPRFGSDVFRNVRAMAYYTGADASWTAEARQDHGGEITWMADCTGGHMVVTDAAVAATCTADGLTEGKHCAACKAVLAEQEVVPAKGHEMKEVPASAPTFEAEGNIAHFLCEVCGKLFADAEGETELLPADVVLEKLTASAMVNGMPYETFSEALAAAKSGDVVQLLQDVREENVIVRKGIRVDLNGFALEAEYVFAVNGADIVDNSAGNTGLLKVAADRVMLSKTNAQLPVWNGEGYVFTTVTYKTRLMSSDSDSLKFAFLPQFKSGATKLLEDGVEGNKVTIEVRVSWMTTMGREYRNLVFNETQVDTVVGTNGAFILTFSGFSQLSMASGISVEGVVISETGVSIASIPIVVDVTGK